MFRYLASAFIVGIICVLGSSYITNPPVAFPIVTSFVIDENESLRSITDRLEQGHYVRSALLLRVILSYKERDTKVQLGEYIFTKPLTVQELVYELTVQGPDKPLLKLTIPEGKTVIEIANELEKILPNFSKDTFVQEVVDRNLEGKLFPSTYFLLPSDTEVDVIMRMSTLFDQEYLKSFGSSTYSSIVPTKEAVISLASILEGEANTPEDMKIVSGILQARLKKNMRLQVDVAPLTYKERGIPSTPINNPGAVAIEAVFHPVPTEYLYYLTGNDGKMYYAKTYTEHKRNIEKYLRN